MAKSLPFSPAALGTHKSMAQLCPLLALLARKNVLGKKTYYNRKLQKQNGNVLQHQIRVTLLQLIFRLTCT